MHRTYRRARVDRKTKRRDYLINKRTAVALMTFYAVASFAGFVITALAVLATAMSGSTLGQTIADDWGYSPVVWTLVGIIGGGIFAATAGLIGFARASSANSALDYVPPLVEQLPMLPCREVLLRGSADPGSSQKELLRAGMTGVADPPSLLLRADNLLLDSDKSPAEEWGESATTCGDDIADLAHIMRGLSE